MNVNKEGLIRASGILGTAMTIVATLLNAYAGKQEQEALIEKKVNEALSKRLIESVGTQK